MKPFQSWVSDMAGSIEDTSVIAKYVSPAGGKELNKLQIRVLFANMLVPHTNSEALVTDWITAFAAGLDRAENGSRCIREDFLSTFLGASKSKEYYALKAYEAPLWLMALRKDIANGITKWGTDEDA